MSLEPGSTAIPFWTTTNAEIHWTYNVNNLGPEPLTTPFGNYFLDLTGFHDSYPYGGITQWINTITGENYALSFALGLYNGEADPSLVGPISVLASAGTTSQTFTFNSSAPGNQQGQFRLNFTAQNSYTPISFLGTFTQGGNLIALDNVSVKTAPVPEPFTILGSGIALGFGGFLKRKLGKHQKDEK